MLSNRGLLALFSALLDRWYAIADSRRDGIRRTTDYLAGRIDADSLIAA